ncbi:MAG: hypothetical protein Fur002_09790 [Anaerolineales bacterium]
MKLIFSSPTFEDLIRLLKAWRFWVLSALIGMALGAAVYFIAPPLYRAHATVNVDFNLEQALPQDTDRQHFYYLERETRKMEELAWSDSVMQPLAAEFNLPIETLRGKTLTLSQPAEAGWRFYAESPNPQIAEELASAWANAFVEKIHAEIEAGNINEFVKLEVTQSKGLRKERSAPLGAYLLAGAMGFLTLAALVVLFIKPKTESNVS